MNMAGVQKYFQRNMNATSPFGNFSQIKDARAVKITPGQANAIAKDPAAKAVLDMIAKRVEGMRGTNVQDLVQVMQKAIKQGGDRDTFGNLKNNSLRDVNSNLKVVTALLEKNDKNERLTELQMLRLTHGLQQMADVQQRMLKGDQEFAAEKRLLKILREQAKKDKTQLLNDKTLGRVIGGNNSEAGEREAWKKNGFLSGSRSFLYSMAGPMGPLLHTADEIVTSLRENKEEIFEGFRRVGRVFEKGFGLFTRFGTSFGSLMKGLGGRLSGVGGSLWDLAGRGGRGIGGIASRGWNAAKGLGRSALGFLGGMGGKALGTAAGAAWLGANAYSNVDKGADVTQTTGDRLSAYGQGAASGAMTGASAGAMFGPGGAVIGGLGGAAVGLLTTYISRNWSQIKTWTDGLWQSAKGVFNDGIAGLSNMFGQGIDKLQALWGGAVQWSQKNIAAPAEAARQKAIDYTSNTIIPGAVAAGNAVKNFVGLGSLSAAHEGKSGSVAMDNNGSYAYGKFQFNAKAGGIDSFFRTNPEYAQQFAGLAPNSPEFNARWKQLAKTDPNFEAAQDKAAKSRWYDPASNRAQQLGFKTDNRGIQEAIFSGSINHGGINRILEDTAKTPGFKDMNEQDQIRAFYSTRRKYVQNAKIQGGARVVDGLMRRYGIEEGQALGIAQQNGLDLERQRLPGVSAPKPTSNIGGTGTAAPTSGAKQTSIQDIPMVVDDLGLLIANTSMFG